MDRLREDHRVWFSGSVSQLDRIDWHALAVIGSVVGVEPESMVDAARLPSLVDDVFMNFSDEGRPVSLRGRLYDRTGTGDWRFRLTDGVHRRRRRPFRIDLLSPVTLRRAGGDVETQALDIGLDGARIAAGDGLAAGEVVRAALSVPGEDEPFDVSGPLVDAGAPGALDLRFVDIDRMARSRLGAFLIAHQRALWRRRQAYQRALAGVHDDLDL